MSRNINKKDIGYLKLFKSEIIYQFNDEDHKDVGSFIKIKKGQANLLPNIGGMETQQLLDYTSQLKQAKQKKLDQFYVDENNVVSPVDNKTQGKLVHSVNETIQGINDIKEKKAKLKNDSSLQKLGLYAFTKDKVQKIGGFWKNFFTFNLGNYFRAHDELKALKEDIIADGFSEKQLETVENLYHGNDKAWENLEEIDENGQQKINEEVKKESARVPMSNDIKKDLSEDLNNNTLSQKVELNAPQNNLNKNNMEVNQ